MEAFDRSLLSSNGSVGAEATNQHLKIKLVTRSQTIANINFLD
ncbi:hypothetical protein [Pseudomonas asplenii]|nr:hypothetical protein [Pseudomonas fuscovaginae]